MIEEEGRGSRKKKRKQKKEKEVEKRKGSRGREKKKGIYCKQQRDGLDDGHIPTPPNTVKYKYDALWLHLAHIQFYAVVIWKRKFPLMRFAREANSRSRRKVRSYVELRTHGK